MLEYEEHDHTRCIDQVLKTAEARCQERGVRLTEQRKSVLALLAESHVPASAYDLLEKLNRVRQGAGEAPLAPVSIYRALEFLSQQKLVHRIESRNAYVACLHGDEEHGEVTVFLLCDKCGRAGEFHSDALSGLVETIARTEHFQAHAPILEISGTCIDCQVSDCGESG